MTFHTEATSKEARAGEEGLDHVNQTGRGRLLSLGMRMQSSPQNQDAELLTTRRYSPEEKGAAVRMVRTLRSGLGTERGTDQGVAKQLGYGRESVRTWVKQTDVKASTSAGTRPLG